MCRLWASVAVAVLGGSVVAAEPAFVPFGVDWSAPPDSPASMAFLLEAPAGKAGFLQAKDGHLADATGKRFRIWGVNLTGKATTPSKEAAPLLAAHLARCGVNCVRFHFLDRPAPQGLIDASRDDTRALDPAQLERFDYFVAELARRGVYSNLNLNVGRTYKAGDGVRDHELLGFAKGLTYFDRRLLELQKEYARQLLSRRNRHTGNEYRHEPAVAMIELVNENSLVESWFSGRLLGKAARKNPGTWTDIPASYERDLTASYNRWLEGDGQRLARLRAATGTGEGQLVPRLRPDEFGASTERFRAEAAFYMELERRYFDDLRRFLRDELGVRPLLVGTSDHNHGKSGYPLTASISRLDVVDGHVYWQHPRYLEDPKTRRTIGFEIPNTPMVNEPGRSTPVQLARTAVAGKPYMVSEVNHPFPHEYACEGIPVLAAYAALHDWDGLFWYTLAHEPLVDGPARPIGHFDLGPDAMKMTQIAACGPMFVRGDLQPARRVVGRTYSEEQVVESLRLPWSESPLFTPGMPPTLPLVHGVRIESLAGPPTAPFAFVPADPIVADTGEIVWSGARQKRGVVTIDSPRSQALVGFLSRASATKNLAARVENGFAAVTLASLDDRPIAESSRLLLTTTARSGNSGMEWNADRKSLTRWGGPPATIEPIAGAIALRQLRGAVGVSAQALDGAGRPLGPPRPAIREGDGWSLTLGSPPTTWLLLRVAR